MATKNNHGTQIALAAAAIAAFYWRNEIQAFLATKLDSAAAAALAPVLGNGCTTHDPTGSTPPPTAAALQGIYHQFARGAKTIWVSPQGRRNPKPTWMR